MYDPREALEKVEKGDSRRGKSGKKKKGRGSGNQKKKRSRKKYLRADKEEKKKTPKPPLRILPEEEWGSCFYRSMSKSVLLRKNHVREDSRGWGEGAGKTMDEADRCELITSRSKKTLGLGENWRSGKKKKNLYKAKSGGSTRSIRGGGKIKKQRGNGKTKSGCVTEEPGPNPFEAVRSPPLSRGK